MRPTNLTPTSLLMCFFNLCGFVFVNWGAETALIELVFILVIVTVSFVVLYHFWLGRNWARILVILTSLVALVNLLLLLSSNLAQQIIIALEALLGLFLLYWLNTTEVKMFFRGSTGEDTDAA